MPPETLGAQCALGALAADDLVAAHPVYRMVDTRLDFFDLKSFVMECADIYFCRVANPAKALLQRDPPLQQLHVKFFHSHYLRADEIVGWEGFARSWIRSAGRGRGLLAAAFASLCVMLWETTQRWQAQGLGRAHCNLSFLNTWSAP